MNRSLVLYCHKHITYLWTNTASFYVQFNVDVNLAKGIKPA